MIGGKNDGDWELFDSQGTQLSGYNHLASDFEITIPETGIYTLRLLGSVLSNNNYSFEVSSSNWLSSLLNLDEEVSGAISAKGERDIYAFEGAIGQRIFLDATQGTSSITSKIYDPQGKLIFNGRSNQDSSPLTLTSNGTYQLIFDGSSINTGDYSFNLKNVASADNLELNTPITGSLDSASGVKLYQFNGTQGTVLDFNLDAASWSGANWKLYDPNNQAVQSPSANEPNFQAALALNGIYTLAIIGNGTEVGEFGFEVMDITPAPIAHTGFNTIYNETLQPGVVKDHIFTANAGTQVYLDSLGSNNGSIRMRLIAPDGTYIFDNTSFSADKQLNALPHTGEYTLQVYGQQITTTGSYSYQLLELPQNIVSSSINSLTLGTINHDSLGGLETKVYSFRGKVGQQIVFNGIRGDDVTATLIAPNGSAIYDNDDYSSQNSGIQTLENNGVYHLLIKGETIAPRDYSFQIIDFNFSSRIEYNQTIIDSLEDGRANKVYSFSGSAGDAVAFDFINSSQRLNAKLYAPGNQEILKNTSLNSSLDFVIELPVDGTYSFYIEGGSDASKVDYSFRTYTLGEQANLITPGTGETLLNSDKRLNLFPVTIKVEDANGAINIQDYSINLLADPQNAAPVIISKPTAQYNIKETVYRYQIDTLDPDNDLVTYSLIDSPSGALVDSDTGELIWFPNNVVVGNSYDFTVEVADGKGGVDRQTFSVEVSQPLGRIQGIVFEDLNANGFPDSSFLKGDQPDIFFVIDVSGSMGRSSVDWLNADLDEVSRQNISPLDQELGAILTLAESAIEQGKGDEAQFGIITSGSTTIDMNPFEPGIQVVTTAAADYNNNGILDIREVINGGVGGGGSNTAGIGLAWDLHRSLPGDPNIVFMSDGFIEVDSRVVAAARADGVNIGAFGFTEQGMEVMRLIDPDAAYVANFREITDIFNGFDLRFMSEPIMDGVTVYLDLNNDGQLNENEPSQINRRNDEVSRLGRDLYSFRFDNLSPGTYTLRQVIPNGYTQTTPVADSFIDTITVEGAETFSHYFGNHQVAPVPNSNPVFTSFVPTNILTVGEQLIYNPTATDADGDLLEFELTLAPAGMDVDSETGTVIWQPTEEQIGNTKAILRVNDGRGGSEIQYFEIDVIKPNQAPVFTSSLGDNVSPQVGKPFQYQAVAVDADLDPVTYELTGSNPSGVTIDADTGLVTWTPTSNQLGAGEITVKAIDDKGGEAIQTLELNVIEAQLNKAPDITSTPRNNIRIGTNYSYQVIASDPDGNPLSFNLLSAPEGMVIDDNGRLVWLPTAQQFGLHPVELEVTDGQGGRAVQSFEIAATNRDRNSLPSITSVPDTRTNLEKLYTYQATATDPDGDLLIWSLDSAPEGMVIDSDTGSISWQPRVDQVGTHTVAVQVMDALGAFVGQEFTLTVTGVNTSPQFVSTPITNGSANLAYTYQATATDAENDQLSYSLGVHPDEMTIDPDTGVINWTPPRGGSYEVEVLVFDSQRGSNKQVFTLEIESETINSTPTITTTPTVTEDNIAPVITSTPISNGKVGQSYTYQVAATDSSNDNLLYGFASRPETMTIDPDTGEITWIPVVGGNYEIEVLVFDEHGAGTSQEFTVDVEALPPNTAPTITSSPNSVADVDTAYSYQVVAEDLEGDVLGYELIAAPDGMTIDSATGAVIWANPILGQHQVVIGVRDGEVGVAQGYTLSVKQNQAPVVNFAAPPISTVLPGETYSYDVPAYDPEGDRLFYTLDPLSVDKGLTIDELGRLRWQPSASDAGNHPVTITITDEVGAEIEQSFTVEVIADTEAPQVTLNPNNIFVVDGQYQTGLNSTVTFQAWATDNVGVTGVQLLVNGVPVVVDANGIADITFDELGTVELKAIALDAAGNLGEATATVEVYDFSDVDAPRVNIDLSDIEENIVTVPVDIIGTVEDDNFDYYTVEIAPANSDGQFVELYRSDTAVDDGVLTTFDPTTLANDVYTLKVTAFDTGGNASSSTETIYVEGELKLGNFQLSFTDLTVPVAGIPISVTRTYDTLTASNAEDFGYGWRLEFRDTDLRTSLGRDKLLDTLGLPSKNFAQDEKVFLTLPGGKRTSFTFQPELHPEIAALMKKGGFVPEAARLYLPKFVADDETHGMTLSVSRTTLLKTRDLEYMHASGTKYNPAYSAFGGRYFLSTDSGIVYDIDANTGEMLSATDTNGNKLNFSDDGITSDSGIEIKFGRDGQGRITSVIDPDGKEIRYQYDEAGDLISVTDREKNTTRYDYSEARAHFLDEITDPLNRPAVKSEYDEQGRLKKIIDTDGDPIEFIYDPDNSIQITKDALGNPTIHEYDGRGNVIREANALGHETLLEYDDNNNVTKVTEPNGNITEYTYDDKGNVLSRTALHHPDDPNPEVTRYTYNKFNQNTAVILPTGAVFKQNYDDYGNLLSMTDGEGNIIQAFTYDTRGNVTSETDSTGTSYYSDFDSFGNARRVQDSFGDIITSTYDSKGNITSFTDDEGTSTFTYDDSGREIRADYGDGVYVEYGYEGAGSDWTVLEAPTIGRIERKFTDDGKLGGWVTPGGEELTFTYDDAGRLKTEVTPDGTTTYEYDKLGRVIQVTNSNSGLITQMHYDTVVGEDPDPGVADNLIGKLAARTVIVDENTSYTTSYTYYADGRTKTVTDANKNTWFYEYDGTSTTITDPLGRKTTSVQTDQYLPSETIYADGSSSKVEYLYDNNLQEATDYPTVITDRGGNDRHFGYDELGRLISATDLGDTSYSYVYGDSGLARVESPTGGNVLAYTYDDDGNVTSVTYSDGGVKEYTYDDDGNVTQVTLPDGVTIDYQYDEDGIEISRTSSLDGQVFTSYDPDGRLLSIEDTAGTTEYVYDESTEEFAGINYGSGANLRYEYDDFGRITQVNVQADVLSEVYSTSYEYDALGNLTKVTDPNGGETVMVYDGVGRLTSRSLPNGVTSSYSYQENTDWVEKIVHTASDGTVLVATEYVRGDAGEPVKITREDGSYVEVDYDSSLRVIKEAYFAADGVETESIEYSYDADGNRLTVSDGVAEGAYGYDHIHQLTDITTATGTETYTYDLAGRIASITRDGETWNLEYNTADLITKISDADGNVVVEYEYDSAGRRIEARDSAGERDYLVAPIGNTDLESPHLVTDENEDLISAYVYGGGMPLMRLDESGNPVYYLTDAMGSVIGLADGSGVEVADFRYDSFGNLRSSTGVEGDRELEAGGDFRFQGQWLESTTDLYHFRARYYDPESGRFVSRDPVELIEYEPESSNPYQFVYNNPHIYSDPTGEFTLSDVNASQTIQNILQKQAYNSIRQELIDKAKGVVSDILVSTATTFIQSLVPGTEFTGALNDVLGNNRESQRGGRTWERLLTDTVCDAVFGSYSSQIRDLWIQPIVQPDGTPSFDGFNCGGYTYTLRNRVISTRGRGLPSGPRPDFIIKNGGPAGTDKDPKAYIIGDIKSSWNAVDSKVGSRQWKAITSYAKYSNGHQFIPSALYVTMIGGHESLHRRVVRKGIEKGVYVYFLTLFPNIRR